MKKITIGDDTFDLDIEEDEIIEIAKNIEIKPCYVPGNFPWQTIKQ